MNASAPFILCPTDFGPRSAAGALVAARIALRQRRRLRLVHAAGHLPASVLESGRIKMAAEVARCRSVGIDVEGVVLDRAKPLEDLVAYIGEEGPALVVVGCGVKSPLDRWTLGSLSEELAETSSSPTLLVRDPSVFENWDWGLHRLRLLLAVDMTAESDVVLRWARNFQREGPCDLFVGHAYSQPPAGDRSGADAAPGAQAERQKKIEGELYRKTCEVTGIEPREVIARPYFGDPAVCLGDLADEADAQLIAVGAHQHRGFRRALHVSLSRELIHLSSRNLVCVPLATHFDPSDAHIPSVRRVLVTTDLSELGNSAIPFAFGICGERGHVRILHVHGHDREPGRPETDELHATRLVALRALVPKEKALRGQEAEIDEIESENVAAAICADAEKFGADVVCMAAHGAGWSQALHGSTTRAVQKKLQRPLLVVRHP